MKNPLHEARRWLKQAEGLELFVAQVEDGGGARIHHHHLSHLRRKGTECDLRVVKGRPCDVGSEGVKIIQHHQRRPSAMSWRNCSSSGR